MTEHFSQGENSQSNFSHTLPLWQRLSLKTKATVLAIAFGTIPVAGIGVIAYNVADGVIRQQIYDNQEADTIAMMEKLQSFLQNYYLDLQSIADLSIFSDSQLRTQTTIAQKSQELNKLVKYRPMYESLTFMDLEGNDVAISSGSPGNHRNDEFFQAVLQTKKPFISQPQLSQSLGEKVIYIAAPVQDSQSNQLVGIIRTRIPIKSLETNVDEYSAKDSTYHFVDRNGTVFMTNDKPGLNLPATEHLASFKELREAKATKTFEFHEIVEQRYAIGTYVAMNPINDVLDLGWDGFLVTEENIAFAAQSQIAKAILIGTIVTALLLAFITTLTTNRLIQPIIQAAQAIALIGSGDLKQRLSVKGADELAVLGTNINKMTEQIANLLEQQKRELAVQEDLRQAQTELATQEKIRNQQLQEELFNFLSSIEEVSSGNLTVRANITDGQIGIVADFFNSIIESLRDIVTQVKTATTQVNNSIIQDESAIQRVTQEALEQTQKISNTLNAVEEMTLSIQQVASNAQEAAKVSHTASITAETGGQAIEKTVNSILQLRETVASTAKKVKRLGESSQEISKVVSLINQIAMQTNLLAINASIEASRAGEEGKGFAVVAEEVGELAIKSAEATKEIEEIVENIQEETQEVVAAMEIGTAQVVEGTQLVENTKYSLQKIVEVSQQIEELLESISLATISQKNTSQTVTQLITEVAQGSQLTSETSQQVCSSLEETVKIAQKLEESVGTFKV